MAQLVSFSCDIPYRNLHYIKFLRWGDQSSTQMSGLLSSPERQQGLKEVSSSPKYLCEDSFCFLSILLLLLIPVDAPQPVSWGAII